MGKISYFKIVISFLFIGIIVHQFFIQKHPDFSIEKDGIVVRGQIIKITHRTLQQRTVSIGYSYKVENQEYTGMDTFNNFVLENLPQIGDSCRVIYYVKDPNFSNIIPLHFWLSPD